MHTALRFATVVLALLLPSWQAVAADATIYRWTDEQGHVHYAASVPEKYRKTATPVDADRANPTPAQQREAQDRAARQKDRASRIVSVPARPAAAASRPGAAPSAPTVKRPAQVPDEDTDCATWARLYRESLDCFGPFRTARGATREEAFTYCRNVEAPPSRCRAPIPE